jgi:hypothetical protein
MTLCTHGGASGRRVPGHAVGQRGITNKRGSLDSAGLINKERNSELPIEVVSASTATFVPS